MVGVNDHCILRNTSGNWRLVAITGSGNGDLDSERRLTVGVSEAFPPVDAMREEPVIADFGELAWAPCDADDGTDRWLFWSQRVLHRMRSPDGITWTDHEVVLSESVHPFFCDRASIEVAPGQWLLFCTARGHWFSRVDLCQSFDRRYWQYIRGALSTGWGSERNSSFASTESPTVVRQLLRLRPLRREVSRRQERADSCRRSRGVLPGARRASGHGGVVGHHRRLAMGCDPHLRRGRCRPLARDAQAGPESARGGPCQYPLDC